ncbi:MAG: CDP-alcohol phosphatidyltransferase family protein [Geminicoccaceae bacterium]
MNLQSNPPAETVPADMPSDDQQALGQRPAADRPSSDERRPIVVMIGESDARIWGLTTEERLRRITKTLNVSAVLKDGEARPATESIVLIRADYAIEDRLVTALVNHEPGFVLVVEEDDGRSTIAAAAHVDVADADAVAQLLRTPQVDRTKSDTLGLTPLSPIELGTDYNARLRKREIPYVLEVGPQSIQVIENRIFAGSYKGITDFVTKYCWPLPARWVTRQAVRFGWTPNMVTGMSLMLVFVTLWLFMQGHFLTGLAVGWFMTFLDTVDGKLARVTLTSSPWGNVFDHGIDLIHPPFWYWAWWYGLHQTVPEAASLPYLDAALMVVIIGYVVGRLEEGVFIKAFGIQIHIWRPIDSFFRLITARRNPNLAILMVAALFGAPGIGFLLVAVWTIFSLLFHAMRIIQAFIRKSDGGIRSHLTEPLEPTTA